MKITLCGSISHLEQMESIKHQLEVYGHEVAMPVGEGREIYALLQQNNDVSGLIDYKHHAMHRHFEKIKNSDAILVCNYTKNGIENYIGGNTLIEIGVAAYAQKILYILNAIPEVSYKDEIFGTKPIVLNGDIELLML